MIPKNVTSVTNLPNNPPNPSSITDIPMMNEEKLGKKPEDEEMPPLVDITDEDTGYELTHARRKPEENLHCNGFSLQFSM